jgi:hypothetical protein
MKFSRVTAAIVMVSLSSPLFAGAEQAIGKLTSADQGTFVSRDGKLVPAFAGQQLYAGDRVVTRGKARASVQSQGCSYTVAPTSMLSVAGCRWRRRRHGRRCWRRRQRFGLCCWWPGAAGSCWRHHCRYQQQQLEARQPLSAAAKQIEGPGESSALFLCPSRFGTVVSTGRALCIAQTSPPLKGRAKVRA